ncbi:hypothetical protein JQS43_21985 [Natronosporangium hydrolyticum]|uniref:Uncharacterized protein n=1 Tax=Natronosporangium hydrolyticum TaxID=2811111 RepID=A0A895Y8U3_9ACTN|nr:hypothetical protein [Natronosporangium hydrolyticum]QSB14164.1 hypothetical protein JQS43_21985 [Natronosporangium hydrolyticum]
MTIAPRRLGTGKDEVICRRSRGYRPPQPTRAPSWWEQVLEDLSTPVWLRRLRRRLRD